MDKNPEVLVCVDIIASLISSMTILLMQNQDGGDIRLNNELAKKIDIAPNKYMTRKNFMYKLVHIMLLEGNGNCVLTVDTVDGYIDNLNFLNMSKVRYVYNDNKYEIKYNNQTLYPDEVLHFVLRPSKESQFKGIGYVNELKNVVSDLAQQQATKNGFLKSKWKPSVILGVETDNIDMKVKLYRVMQEYLKRSKATSRSLSVTFKRVNQIVKGWINYYRIGMMKGFMAKVGQWLRHKIRVIIIKQWKNPKTIYKNLSYINRKYKNGFNHESIFKVANSRLGWCRRCGMNVVNYILNPKLLETKMKDRPALVNPLNYYLRKVGI